MMTSNSPTVLLLMVSCAFFVAVHSNYTMPTPIDSSQLILLAQAEFFEENHTIAIINITKMPESSVLGVALHSTPIRMKDPATQTVASFNTSFTFREEPMNYDPSNPNYVPSSAARGDGFTFLFSSSNTQWPGSAAGRFGIFTNPPSDFPTLVAVEFDSWCNGDTDPGLPQLEHVGVDIGTPLSFGNTPNVTYQTDSCFSYVNDVLGITFWHRDVLYSWIEYDGVTGNLQVRLANTSSRPGIPLLNCTYNLYDKVEEKMWIGFSGSHGDSWSIYYIYNWTFTSFGIPSEFPSSTPASTKEELIGGVSGGILFALVIITIVSVCVCRKRKLRRAEEETWDGENMVEMAGMPGFISYKHLSAATKQFSDQSKLGEGGFGSVYRGVLPRTGAEVAVKKVSSNSRQGEREFLAEVQIISQLRHRNVVELIGFCRDRGKFLLAYELLPRGSLDQALFKPQSPDDVLSWSLRWKIVSGTAEALHYLHEGWRQQVIHRDVKSSNIMLDKDYNPKLGDFGLARLVDHQRNAPTTMVAGTYGYIAPEATGGKFTDKTDVYAFGAVALEVACGRVACDHSATNSDDLMLVDAVWRRWKEGDLMSAGDPLLLGDFNAEQMEKVLKLGLLCTHPDPSSRPSMRQVVQVLAGDVEVPEVPLSRPQPSLQPGMPNLSITDLLSSGRTNSQTSTKSSSFKRSAASTSSMASSSSLGSSSLLVSSR